jgi:nitroreductase
VWLGIYPIEERVDGMRKLISLPDHFIPLGLISLGYPAERKPPDTRFQESRVHDNRW